MADDKNKASENNGMQIYYIITFLLFGLLSVSCFNFSFTWETHTCLTENSINTQLVYGEWDRGPDYEYCKLMTDS